MSEIQLQAEPRALIGKGASRRLRRDEIVPAVVYGGSKPAESIQCLQRHVRKALESERIYSSVFEIMLEGKKERVILKDIQRHPYKALVLHMDFQRVSAKDILVKMIPIHFMNEAMSPGVRAGGVVNHTMTQVEVRCEVRHLPEYIEVDLSTLEMDQVLHLSQLQLPKGVELSIDPTTGDHDHPVVSVHAPRAVIEEETVEAVEEDVIEEEAQDVEADNAAVDTPKAE